MGCYSRIWFLFGKLQFCYPQIPPELWIRTASCRNTICKLSIFNMQLVPYLYKVELSLIRMHHFHKLQKFGLTWTYSLDIASARVVQSNRLYVQLKARTAKACYKKLLYCTHPLSVPVYVSQTRGEKYTFPYKKTRLKFVPCVLVTVHLPETSRSIDGCLSISLLPRESRRHWLFINPQRNHLSFKKKIKSALNS